MVAILLNTLFAVIGILYVISVIRQMFNLDV